MWRNVLMDEGRSIAKRAERAQDEGDFYLARELYLKAVAKFREASEISEDFKEAGILRSLVSYYNYHATALERELRNKPVPASHLAAQPEEREASGILEVLRGTGVSESVFKAVLMIAIEISREGREGHAIGTAFVIGDSEKVMAASGQLVLNPFEGHSRRKRLITDTEMRGNIKEFAQLDGVFVVSGDGMVEAAGRYITIDTGRVRLPKGLGTRHSSVAAVTLVTNALGIVVSQSGGVIRVFRNGNIVATIKP